VRYDVEETRRRLKEAGAQQFAERGFNGASLDDIAAQARVNKQRIYAHFGNKQQFFAAILAEELATLAATVTLTSLSAEGVGDFAGRTYDYHVRHPVLGRLLIWEGLTFGDAGVPDESARRAYYQEKVRAFATAQKDGVFDADLDAAHLIFAITALAAWWVAVPQMARMLEEFDPPDAVGPDHSRRRAAVVRAAVRLALPREDWPQTTPQPRKRRDIRATTRRS